MDSICRNPPSCQSFTLAGRVILLIHQRYHPCGLCFGTGRLALSDAIISYGVTLIFDVEFGLIRTLRDPGRRVLCVSLRGSRVDISDLV